MAWWLNTYETRSLVRTIPRLVSVSNPAAFQMPVLVWVWSLSFVDSGELGACNPAGTSTITTTFSGQRQLDLNSLSFVSAYWVWCFSFYFICLIGALGYSDEHLKVFDDNTTVVEG